DAAEATAFKWIDTKNVRQPGSQAYALINDQEQQIPSGVRDALDSYEIRSVAWSEREEVREKLVA
ncbi:MAG: DUF1829 domain-containing protein, partial [Candidatus Coatesbacteria bacterium]|nr:DUF1829 domain-containing protein [Candidatus Coatesbacteria bacterium]